VISRVISTRATRAKGLPLTIVETALSSSGQLRIVARFAKAVRAHRVSACVITENEHILDDRVALAATRRGLYYRLDQMPPPINQGPGLVVGLASCCLFEL
jgi:hypothetical protein